MRSVSSRCWCDERVLGQLLGEARRWPVRETGGALLGWRDNHDAVIAAVLGPGPEAQHGFSSFEPDGPWQNREGHRIYHESGRTIAYLGDWHTHPRGSARPSRRDLQTAQETAADEKFRAPDPLYGIASKPWRSIKRESWALMLYELVDGDLVEINYKTCDLGERVSGLG